MYLEDKLNKQGMNWQFKRCWTSNITLSNSIRVVFGKPFEGTVAYVFPGAKLNEAATRLQISEQFYFVDRSTWSLLPPLSQIYRDMEIALCHKVVVTGVVNETFFVEHSSRLDSVKELAEFFSGQHIVTNSSDNAAVNGSLSVSQSMNITVRNAKTVSVIISFDEEGKVDIDSVEGAIKDIVNASERDKVKIVVSEEEDGSYFVFVTLPEDSADTVTDILLDCFNSRK